ncbi:MAG TPA: nuclear transport factor 2 family protein [Steroidobacteraceae bacterium]|jgi:hypothetical protein|nr:nuclear transport factor 2 family protein [Steroidobacteraceae bacterium]
MTRRTAVIEAIQTYCRVQTQKGKAGWASLFREDVFHEDPFGIHQTRGKEHVVGAFWDQIVRNDVAIWLTNDVIVCGNEALAIMACDIGPTQNRRRLAPVVDQFVFADDGRIASVRRFYNLP